MLDWEHLFPRVEETVAEDDPIQGAIERVRAFRAATTTDFDLPGHKAVGDYEIARKALMGEVSNRV